MRTRKGHKTALLVAATGALFLGASTVQAVNITVGNGSAQPNQTGLISVSLQTEGQAVVGTLNDIQFSAGAQIAEETDAVTTLATSLDASVVPGTSENPVTFAVVDASGLPDFGTVKIDEELISYGAKDGNNLELAGRGQNGTTVATHNAGATVDPLTLPACVMSPALEGLEKSAVFSFIPDGCTPGDNCEAVRGIVIALNNLGEIPTDTVLYSCTVAAGPDDGAFDLTCPDDDGVEAPFAPAQAAPPPDGPLLPTTCTSGVFNVGAPPCVGDQDGNGSVSSAEATRAVLAFARRDKSLNPAADGDGNGSVSSAEATRSVLNFARRQCNP